MMDPETIRARVAAAIPDATIILKDTAGDGDHYEMTVVSPAFAGMTLVQRHRLVYAPLKDVLGGALHALALKTLAPEEIGAESPRKETR